MQPLLLSPVMPPTLMEALPGSCRIAAAQTCSMWVHPATSQHTACAVAGAGLYGATTPSRPRRNPLQNCLKQLGVYVTN